MEHILVGQSMDHHSEGKDPFHQRSILQTDANPHCNLPAKRTQFPQGIVLMKWRTLWPDAKICI